MRIIGIDPGTGILGFGVIDASPGGLKLVDAGVIKTPAHTPLDERLEEIYDSLTEVISETKPNIMSIEKLFFCAQTEFAPNKLIKNFYLFLLPLLYKNIIC